MNREFVKAFTEVVRGQLAQKKEVRLNGAGTLRVEHHKQFQRRHDDGRVVMVPPEDVVTFTPETEIIHG